MTALIAAIEKCMKSEPIEDTRSEELSNIATLYMTKSSNLIKLTVKKDLEIMLLKQKLSKIHDVLFERQHEVSDGVYLEVMNSLI